MPRLAIAVAFLVVTAACSETTPSSTTNPPPTTTTTTPVPTAGPPETAPPQSTPPETAPAQSTEVVVAIDNFGEFTFNPFHPDREVPLGLGEAYLTGAWKWGDGNQRVPLVVVDIPTTENGGVIDNEDGTIDVTYTIDPNAAWSDGVPITGDDFVFTVELLAEDSSLLPSGRDTYVAVEAVAWTGDTVTVTMAAPTIAYLDLFEVLVPRHAVEGSDFLEDWNATPWPSGGPFVLTGSETPPGSGTRLIFTANDSYWFADADGNQLPRLETVIFELQGDPEQTGSDFANGDINVWNIPPVPALLDSAVVAGGSVQVVSGRVWEHFAFNFGVNNANDQSLNDLLDFRRAVAHGIDGAALLEDTPWAAREILDSPFDLFGLGNASWSRYPYDPERARLLLASACEQASRDCEANPPHLVLSTTSDADERPRIGELVVEQLAAIGIDAELDGQDESAFFGDTINEGTFDLGLWAYVAGGGRSGALSLLGNFDPDDPPRDQLAGGNYTRWGTPAVGDATDPLFNQEASLVRDSATQALADIVDALAGTETLAQFDGLLSEAEELLADQVVFIPLVARGQAVAFQGVDGVRAVSGLPPTWNIEVWRLP